MILRANLISQEINLNNSRSASHSWNSQIYALTIVFTQLSGAGDTYRETQDLKFATAALAGFDRLQHLFYCNIGVIIVLEGVDMYFKKRK